MFLGLALYYNAFWDLDLERNVSKYEPISRSKCFAYAFDYDLTVTQAEDLWYYVARMDKAYLEYRKSKEPPPPKEPKGRTRTRGRRK